MPEITMKVLWTDEALQNLIDIREYIARDSPSAAEEVLEQIIASVDGHLYENPKLGKPGRVPGTRELVTHSSYIAAYTLHENGVVVLTIRHTARLWPDIL